MLAKWKLPQAAVRLCSSHAGLSSPDSVPVPVRYADLPKQIKRRSPSEVSAPKFSKKGEIWSGGFENYSPVIHYSAVVRAGSRFEDAESLGVSHALRMAFNMGTKSHNMQRFIRSMEQVGANIGVTSTREYLIYHVECVRDFMPEVLEMMNEVVVAPDFRPWDWHDLTRRMQLELSYIADRPDIRAVEMIHNAAFSNTLANSIYAPQFMIDHYPPDMLYNYMSTHFLPSSIAVFGIGQEPHVTEKISEHFVKTTIRQGDHLETASKFKHSEIRESSANPTVHVILASHGVGFNNGINDVICAGILQRAIGAYRIKYFRDRGTNRLLKAATTFADRQPFAASAVNVNYSDNGLFGFHVACNHTDIGVVCELFVEEMMNIAKTGLTDVEVTRAKAQLTVDLKLAQDEDCLGCVEDWANQLFSWGKVIDKDELEQKINSITSTDVNQVAKRILMGKPAMAAIGKLSHTPHLSDLFS